MGFSVGLFIHKNKTSDVAMDLEQVWSDIKAHLTALGAELSPEQKDKLLLDEDGMVFAENAFGKHFGFSIPPKHDGYRALFAYHESIGDTPKLFIPYSDETLEVKEFLQISLGREVGLELFKGLKDLLLKEDKYEFSYNFNLGNDQTLLAN